MKKIIAVLMVFVLLAACSVFAFADGDEEVITGSCYRPAVSYQSVTVTNWCAALRERYHTEACNGLNYARAAEGTTDPCLRGLLNELSAEEYRHAEQLLTLLERSLRP